MSGILASLHQEPLKHLNHHVQLGVLAYLETMKLSSKDIATASQNGKIWNGNKNGAQIDTPTNPFTEFTDYRTGGRNVSRSFTLEHGEEKVRVAVEASKDAKYTVGVVEGKTKDITTRVNGNVKGVKVTNIATSDRNVHAISLEMTIDAGNGQRVSGTTCIQTFPDGNKTVDVWIQGQVTTHPTHYQFKIAKLDTASGMGGASSNPVISSPMPGKIVKLHVKDGASVKKGDALAILEAMKMEHIVYAPCDG